MESKRLNIRLNGTHVGILEKTASGALRFWYAQDWLNMTGSRPISLSLPLIDTTYTGDVVFNFFDNLLPDNPDIRHRIQSQLHISSNHPFDLLASIGNDCVGAIQLMRDDHAPSISSIDGQPLSEGEIAALLRDYQQHPLGMGHDCQDFRISIAGAQEKMGFLYHDNQWHTPLGATPTTHIFKLPIGYISHQQMDLTNSCENEWLCAQIAKAFGLSVAHCDIAVFKDMKALIIERFDRKHDTDNKQIMRLPQEDMCQALGISSHLKYQADGGPGIRDIMHLLMKGKHPAADQAHFFKSQVLFWLLCAIDGHAKNFSLFIEPEGRYALTPLYDIMSAFPLIGDGQLHKKKVNMAMALRGKNNHYKWASLRRDHFISTAAMAGYSPEIAAQLLEDMLGQVDAVIDCVTNQLPADFPQSIAMPIFDGMRSVRNQLIAYHTPD